MFLVSLQKMANDVRAKDSKMSGVKDLSGGAARQSHVSVARLGGKTIISIAVRVSLIWSPLELMSDTWETNMKTVTSIPIQICG
jgi:hypothetical protein